MITLQLAFPPTTKIHYFNGKEMKLGYFIGTIPDRTFTKTLATIKTEEGEYIEVDYLNVKFLDEESNE